VPPKSLKRKYAGPEIEVSYDIRRCIHAEECIRVLNDVFDRDKVPWIRPGEAESERVAEAVQLCPSGALQTPKTARPVSNTIRPALNGPLYISGDLEIVDHEGSVMHDDTRLALCRCGASRNKPFCDNQHLEIGFQADEFSTLDQAKSGPMTVEGKLQILPRENGPYRFSGAFALIGRQSQRKFQSENITLCRCGASNEKPFCDNTHRIIGFSAKDW
jgi:CDGSH-type Zn-finger protein/uncharacterized Fe-S cluster protein YjdI